MTFGSIFCAILESLLVYFRCFFGDPLILWFLQPLPHDSLVFEGPGNSFLVFFLSFSDCFYRVGFQTHFSQLFLKFRVPRASLRPPLGSLFRHLFRDAVLCDFRVPEGGPKGWSAQ